jgi:hypothetical protein
MFHRAGLNGKLHFPDVTRNGLVNLKMDFIGACQDDLDARN